MGSILFDIDARGVATLTLNRPEKFNNFDAESIGAFLAALDRCERSPAIRVLCIRAAGKHFCAGADVRQLPRKPSPGETRPEEPALTAMLRRLNSLPIPTVALIQGASIGGGAGLVACCDVAIAEADAYLMISEVRLGIPPAALVPYFAGAIGQRQLRRYALSGERIGAARAREISFVHEVCAPGQLSETAAPILDAFLLGGPRAIARTKDLIAEAVPVAWSEEADAALVAQLGDIVESPEATEGVAAFLEKRKPSWYRAA
jgi:methylglutaconyl-CoA hydratase